MAEGFGSPPPINIRLNAKKAKSAIESFSAAMGKSSSAAKVLDARLLLLGAGVASVAAAIKLTASAAIKFESSFAGVRKTVDATEAEFGEISGGLRKLAREDIPTSVHALNKIAESAGQLGIAKENIISFTATVANLARTTDLSEEVASSSLAKIANITRLPQTEFENLGSAIVDLGNNFATTESQIVDYTLRIGGAGKIIGLTVPQIVGIGTAASSMGVQAEAGGTALQKAFLKILDATREGGKSLSILEQTAVGLSGTFKEEFEENAAGAFVSFVEGLAVQGKEASGTLDSLGLSSERVKRLFLSLAQNTDLLREAIERGGFAFNENTALSEEAAKRYATLESALTLLKNQVVDTGITLGNLLLPAIRSVTESIGEATTTVNDFGRVLATAGVSTKGWLGELIKIATGWKAVTEAIKLAGLAIGKLSLLDFRDKLTSDMAAIVKESRALGESLDLLRKSQTVGLVESEVALAREKLTLTTESLLEAQEELSSFLSSRYVSSVDELSKAEKVLAKPILERIRHLSVLEKSYKKVASATAVFTDDPPDPPGDPDEIKKLVDEMASLSEQFSKLSSKVPESDRNLKQITSQFLELGREAMGAGAPIESLLELLSEFEGAVARIKKERLGDLLDLAGENQKAELEFSRPEPIIPKSDMKEMKEDLDGAVDELIESVKDVELELTIPEHSLITLRERFKLATDSIKDQWQEMAAFAINSFRQVADGSKTASEAVRDVGAMAGTAIGFAFGDSIGAAIGGMAGDMLGQAVGDMFKETRGFARIDVALKDGLLVAGKIRQNLKGNVKELEGIFSDLSKGMNRFFEGMGLSLKGIRSSFDVMMQDGRGVVVSINNIQREFGQDLKGAMEFLIIEISKRAEFSGGVSKAVRQAALESRGDFEKFSSDIQAIQDVVSLADENLQELAQRVEDSFSQFGARVEVASRFDLDFGPVLDALLDQIQGVEDDILSRARGLGPRNTSVVDSITDIQSRFRALRSEAQQVNATISAEIASRRAEVVAIQARLSAAKSELEIMRSLSIGMEEFGEVLFDVGQGLGFADFQGREFVQNAERRLAGLDEEILRLGALEDALSAAIQALERSKVPLSEIGVQEREAINKLVGDVLKPIEDAVSEFRGVSPETSLEVWISQLQELRDAGLVTAERFSDLTAGLDDMRRATEAAEGAASRLAARQKEIESTQLRQSVLGFAADVFDRFGDAQQAAELRARSEFLVLEISRARLELEIAALEAVKLNTYQTVRSIAGIRDTLADVDRLTEGLGWEDFLPDVQKAVSDLPEAGENFRSNVIDAGDRFSRQVESSVKGVGEQIDSFVDSVASVLTSTPSDTLRGQVLSLSPGSLLPIINELNRRFDLGLSTDVSGPNSVDRLRGELLDLADAIDRIKLAENFESLIRPIKEFRENLRLGEFSPLSPRERVSALEERFKETLSQALSGDEKALRDLPTASKEFLDSARGFFQSSTKFQDVLKFVDSSLARVETMESDMSRLVTVSELSSDRNHTDLEEIKMILADIRKANDRVSQAQRLSSLRSSGSGGIAA